MANRIRQRMKLLKLTHADIASRLGIERAAVTQWVAKKDAKRPTLENLFALADILKCDAGWLVNGNERGANEALLIEAYRGTGASGRRLLEGLAAELRQAAKLPPTTQ